MPAELRCVHPITEAEVRRYLWQASTQLGRAAPVAHVDDRVRLLRGARHWLIAALAALDGLLDDAEAVPDEVDDPLTVAMVPPTIEAEP